MIGLALAGLFVYLLLAAFEGDNDAFGRAPAPGTSLVKLPEGETDVFYFEAAELDPGLPVGPPVDLGFTVLDPELGGLRVDSRSGDAEEAEGGVARLIGAVFVPADGTYEVSVTSDELAGRVSPALTFGQSPLQAVGARFESVVDELKGPTGIAVAVALLLLFLLPSVRRALRRSSSD